MKWYWKTAIGVGVLLVVLLLANVGLNLWLKYKLPSIINNKNDSAYYITYENLTVDIWSGSVDAHKIVIVPKAAVADTINKAGIYGKVAGVHVSGVKAWSLLFSDKIKASSISVDTPKIILYKKPKDKNAKPESIRESVVAPFDKIIAVSSIALQHGDVKILSTTDDALLFDAKDVNLKLDGVVVTDDILKHKIPFAFKQYEFRCDSLFYKPNPVYNYHIKNIRTTNDQLELTGFKVSPQRSRSEFVKSLAAEKDLYTISAEKLTVADLDWGFKDNDDLFVYTKKVTIDGATANIYRNKIPTDDLTKKHLYNKLLRELKFDLKVDTLQVRNANVEYEEEKEFGNGAGKLTFNQFNLTARNIYSGFKRGKMPDLKIKIKCKFMNTSPLDVDWSLNVMDKSDGFFIQGTLLNFDAEKIVPFTKPYMNVTTKGIINTVHFKFRGNDVRASGDFAVKYDDLKLTVFKKDDRRKKNKLLTAVGNLFVKNDSGEQLKHTRVELDRIQEKSFYNFLWRSVAEGLKKILI